MNEKAILIEDVFSNFEIRDKNRKPYGKKGEEVKVISESLPVLIVENKKGDRFSVLASNVNIKTK